MADDLRGEFQGRVTRLQEALAARGLDAAALLYGVDRLVPPHLGGGRGGRRAAHGACGRSDADLTVSRPEARIPEESSR